MMTESSGLIGEGLCTPHMYIPHPTEIMKVVCVCCGKMRTCKAAKVLWYNAKRRRFKSAAGLYSLIVPFSESSRQLLRELSRKYGVVSNTTAPYHITLAEGFHLASQTGEQLSSLRATMMHGCVRVIGTKLLATRQNRDKCLLLLELEFGGETVASLPTNCCMMPQYPLHAALGLITESKNAEILMRDELQGKELNLIWSCMQQLPPPLPPDHNKLYNKLVEALRRVDATMIG